MLRSSRARNAIEATVFMLCVLETTRFHAFIAYELEIKTHVSGQMCFWRGLLVSTCESKVPECE